ncbi:hypothetical protein MMC19_002837 [Ptychographa xylographoides]|nr:hypothetical protein [Ptychographa xylographoides]
MTGLSNHVHRYSDVNRPTTLMRHSEELASAPLLLKNLGIRLCLHSQQVKNLAFPNLRRVLSDHRLAEAGLQLERACEASEDIKSLLTEYVDEQCLKLHISLKPGRYLAGKIAAFLSCVLWEEDFRFNQETTIQRYTNVRDSAMRAYYLIEGCGAGVLTLIKSIPISA